MDAHIKKSSIVEAAKALLREGVKKRFPTYDAAIAEIERLESALNRLAANKPRRGRPRDQSGKKEIKQIKKDFPILYEWIRQRVPVAKGGRPNKYTYQQKINCLKEYDDRKQLYAKVKRKKRLTDKEFIEFQVNTDQTMKAWSEHRRREKIESMRKVLKYFREEVKKRKTPLN